MRDRGDTATSKRQKYPRLCRRRRNVLHLSGQNYLGIVCNTRWKVTACSIDAELRSHYRPLTIENLVIASHFQLTIRRHFACGHLATRNQSLLRVRLIRIKVIIKNICEDKHKKINI